MSALDNVTLGMRFTRDSKQVRQRKAKAMLSRLGLGHVAGDKIMTPSPAVNSSASPSHDAY